MPDRQTNQKTLAISEFASDSLVFEFRYDNAYLLWDQAGYIWSELLAKHTGMEMSDANPVSQTFTWKKKYTLTITLSQSSITSLFPDSSLKEFMECAESFFVTVSTNLKVEIFTRIGLRRVFVHEYPSRQQAVRDLLTTGILRPPQTPNFGVEAEVLPEYALRWEGENIGATVRVKVEHRKWEVELPLIFEDQKIPTMEKDVLVYDVDYYTKGQVSLGQFRTKDWINNALNLMKNDSYKFLKGNN